MIVQGIVDWLVYVFAQLVALIPPMPAAVGDALGSFEGGMSWIAGLVGPLGIILPFDAISLVIGLFLILLGYWAAVWIIRIVFWVMGR